MTLNNTSIDPYRASDGYFECVSCGHRESSTERLHECPECGDEMRNIGVARE